MACGTRQAGDAVEKDARLLWVNDGVIGPPERGMGTNTDNCMAGVDQRTEAEKRLYGGSLPL